MKLTFSLRTKFTVVLLATSLLSLFAAGLIARDILVHEFSNILMQESFQRFRTEMTLYFETYGSWKQAQQKESFAAFEQRRDHLLRSPMTNIPNLPRTTISNPALADPTKPQPAFHFTLADLNGQILLSRDGLKIGAMAPAQLLKKGQPIFLNNSPVALALPDPRPNLQDLGLDYLKAVRQALLAAALTAVLLALVLGMIIGERLNGRISRLTSAIQAMQEGNLYQRIEEYSRDEIGILANAFNHMSSELAEMHDALHQSNSQIRKQAKHLKELSIHDELTGLFNRRYADEQGASLFTEAINNPQPFTVAIGDIDFFKKINDGYSHAAGDEVLRRVSDILQEHVREGDILARYGGEEFVIILPQTALLLAAALCEKLRERIAEYPWHEIHPDLGITMSFGLCDDNTHGSFEKQLAVADNELHEAKTSGRNRVCFDIQQLR